MEAAASLTLTANSWFDRTGESILTADIDLGEIVRGKFDLDVTGHYARPDVFQLQVNEAHQLPVQLSDGETST